jgi:hypothetical protein
MRSCKSDQRQEQISNSCFLTADQTAPAAHEKFQMVDVPSAPGASGVRLLGVTARDSAQFDAVISEIEGYSQRLVADFDGATAQICARLSNHGDVAAQALAALSSSHADLDAVISGTFGELEGVVADIESLGGEFEKLDTIQAELVLLSDLLRTVEETVKRGA